MPSRNPRPAKRKRSSKKKPPTSVPAYHHGRILRISIRGIPRDKPDPYLAAQAIIQLGREMHARAQKFRRLATDSGLLHTLCIQALTERFHPPTPHLPS